jgi:acetyltransferase-like isoleucine patch superfamily enzyme
VTGGDLLEALRDLYRLRERDLRDRFDRSVPFADAVLENRWERAARLGFGEGTSIYDSALVLGTVRVGTNSWIGPGTILDGAAAALTIGDFCSISAGVHLYTHDTVLWALSGGVAGKRTGPVLIGDRCHVGAQAVVLPGISIGSMCVVAANSVVNRDVPDRTIVAGSPARAIGTVEGDGAGVRLAVGTQVAPP